MNLVIFGPKGAGKTTISGALAKILQLPLIETDRLIEARDGGARSCREIYVDDGEERFRSLEREVSVEAAERDWHIIVTGGGTFMDPAARQTLRTNALLIFLIADRDTIWQRLSQTGLPPWLSGADGFEKFEREYEFRLEVQQPFADIQFDSTSGDPEELATALAGEISQALAARMTAANTFGDVIRVTTFGESHGTAIGCVLDGVKPGHAISEETIQRELDRRRPGQSKVVTQRKEPDVVSILSGIFEGKTTGAPIALVIYNKDQDSRKYEEIKDLFRPGHADFTFYKKYGHRDYRGGGRSSGRETATRVAAGAVAKEILRQRGVQIRAHTVEIAGIRAAACDYEVIESNPVRSADPEAAEEMEAAILAARKDRDSVGGVIQLDIDGVPPGLGDPVFGKLDARLTSGIMTLGAAKGVEVGDGFELVRMRGSESNDAMRDGGFLSNHGGGITGGISTGQTIRMRVAIKPTASIAKTQETIDREGHNREISVGGRHDPCIVPRAVPVLEHIAAVVLLDAWEVQERLRPGWVQG